MIIAIIGGVSACVESEGSLWNWFSLSNSISVPKIKLSFFRFAQQTPLPSKPFDSLILKMKTLRPPSYPTYSPLSDSDACKFEKNK